MTKTRSNTQTSKQRKSKTILPPRKLPELSIGAVQYNGPVRELAFMRQQDLYTTVFSTDGIISSTAGGVIAPVFPNTPDNPGGGLGSCADWSSAVAVFDEYRVLAFEVEFLSVYDQLISGATTVLSGVVDFDSSNALTSYGVADAYGSQKIFSVQEYDGKVKKMTAHMSGIENSVFTTTAFTSPQFWIKLYGSGFVVSTPIIHAFVRYRVQFRGRA
jgi:hypothetical protein